MKKKAVLVVGLLFLIYLFLDYYTLSQTGYTPEMIKIVLQLNLVSLLVIPILSMFYFYQKKVAGQKFSMIMYIIFGCSGIVMLILLFIQTLQDKDGLPFLVVPVAIIFTSIIYHLYEKEHASK